MKIKLYAAWHEVTTNSDTPPIQLGEVHGGYRWIARTHLSSQAPEHHQRDLIRSAALANELLDRIDGKVYNITESGTVDLLQPCRGLFTPTYLISAGDLEAFLQFKQRESTKHECILRAMGQNYTNTPTEKTRPLIMTDDYLADASSMLSRRPQFTRSQLERLL